VDFSNIAINNFVDIIFYLVMFIFAMIGLFRGLVSEVFSSLNWIISFLTSIFLSPFISRLLAPYFSQGILLDIGVRIGVFLTFFLILFFGFSDFFKRIREIFPGVVDKPLGLGFGVGKTLVLFGFVYSLYSNLYDFISTNKGSTNQSQEASSSPSNIQNSSNGWTTSDNQNEGNSSSVNSGSASAGANKFPKVFLDANCVNFVVFSGRLIDPVVQPIYEILIKNYGTAIKENLFKKFEENMRERLTPKNSSNSGNGSNLQSNENGQGEWKSLVKDSEAVDNSQSNKNSDRGQLSEMIDMVNDINGKKSQSGQDGSQNNNQGYKKNEIDKKDRIFDIINQQLNKN